MGDQLRPGHKVIYARGSSRVAVPARTGLVGNPSDVFGGAVVGLALDELEAVVTAVPAVGIELSAGSEKLVFESVAALETDPHPSEGPLALLWAAVRRYMATRPVLAKVGVGLALESSTIPPGVGLAGSSAIVIATLRALGDLFGDPVPDGDLPSLALACERDELGIPGGLGDRVVQVYGGLVYLDLGAAGTKVEPLDSSRLPDLFVAWRPGAPTDSGDVHREMKARFAAGDRAVVQTVREIAGLARAALKPLLTGDGAGLAVLMERNLELRRELYGLDPRHAEMAKATQALGSAVNYSGSGGAIVGLYRDDAHLAALREALAALGCELIVKRAG